MKIIDKINQKLESGEVFHSFEYFPPKTQKGVQNLYSRIDRMVNTDPLFIDVTWGAGGTTSELTIEIATNAQNLSGVETQIHMTCTNMNVEDLDKALETAKEQGLQNILCLRGDPPGFMKGNTEWTQTEGGFEYAKDLVAYIRKKYGDYFGIAVAGYPEGHPEGSYDEDLKYLKEKVDAGADFVITQLFYDVDQFLKFVQDARKIGITCPILPGIMPISNYKSWERMVSFCKAKVPQAITDAFAKINVEDDAEVKNFGNNLCVDMCNRLIKNGVKGLHLYTLNLEKSCVSILEGLKMIPQTVNRQLPWKLTANAKRQNEEVRPIFWSNRPSSYIERTQDWEFTNGRWGSSESPAFGELTDYHLVGQTSNPDTIRKTWGNIKSIEDVCGIFTGYLNGEVSSLPFCDKPMIAETSLIKDKLLLLNSQGYLTINSQPSVDGTKSDDPIVGWGPKHGYVYQKAYLEFFCSPKQMKALFQNINKYPSLNIMAVNRMKDSRAHLPSRSVAVTWGVFPNSEIKQPTVVDDDAFLVWSEEAFEILNRGVIAHLDKDSPARKAIEEIYNHWYLVFLVDNDYMTKENEAIFKIFEEE